MVKEELGSDAVILHTKRYKKKSGILGLKSKSVVEVTAAVEDNEAPARPPAVHPDMDAGSIRQVIARTRPVAPENRVQSAQPAPKIDIQSTLSPSMYLPSTRRPVPPPGWRSLPRRRPGSPERSRQ